MLSGGGAKGAFQVGVLDQLITKRKVKVDIAVGTSTGSIQALAVAEDDLPKLIRLWTEIKGNDDIYRKRGGTFLAVINGKPSLYDASPLRALLEKNVDEARLQANRQKPSRRRGQSDHRRVPVGRRERAPTSPNSSMPAARCRSRSSR